MKILALLAVCVVGVWTFECGGLSVTECEEGVECCVVSITSEFRCAPFSQKGDYCLSNSTEYTKPYQFYCPCEKPYQCLFRGDYLHCT